MSVKLLFVTEYYPPAVQGGGELSCALLAQYLAKAGYAVTVLTSKVSGLPLQRVEKGVNIIRKLTTGKSPRSLLSNMRRVVQFHHSLMEECTALLSAHSFDIVHCFNMTSIPAVELKKQFDIPFIAHVNSLLFACPKGDLLYHGEKLCQIHCTYSTFVPCLRDSTEIGKMRISPLLSYNPIALSTIYARYFNQKRFLLQFDRVIAISRFMAEKLAFIGIQKQRIEVLHNIVEIERFFTGKNREGKTNKRIERKEIKRKEIKSERINLLFLGTLSAAKGIPDLLNALSGLKGNWQCNVYGTGPLQKEVQSAARRDSRIIHHRSVIDRKLPSLYRQADIILFPSRWPEPFGRIAVEAMAAGKPIITTNIGGIKDTVTRATGVLIPPANPSALRSAISSLLNDPALRQKLGRAGKRRAISLFAPKHLTFQMAGIYKKMKKKSEEKEWGV